MSAKRDAVAADLRALADDLKSLLDSATTDPKERARKERRYRVLYGAAAAVSALAARRVATKLWSILTGEQPPTKRASAPPPARPEPEREKTAH